MAHSDPLGIPSSFVCAGLAVLAGLSITLAAIAVAYPNYKSSVQKVELGNTVKYCGLLLNLVCTGCSVGLGAVASWYGPLSISFPISVASNLLTNMLLQSAIGMATYTKNMRVGTLVLTASVTLLLDIGPGDLPEDIQDDQNQMIQMLTAPAAASYTLLSFGMMVGGLVALKKRYVTENDALVFIYAVVGCSGTVFNNSLAKLLVVNLDVWVKGVMSVIYIAVAIICLGTAAMANGTLEDPSRFVPVAAGINLILTCLAGLCIWGDGFRIHYPLAYGMVYVLIILGVYDISTFGFGGSPQAATFSFFATDSFGGSTPLSSISEGRSGRLPSAARTVSFEIPERTTSVSSQNAFRV